MSVHLYLGPAAGGKTAFAVTQARQVAGKLAGTVMVCVANQSQRRAWKERLAERGGALGVQVLTFGELCRTLLRAAGEASAFLDDAMQHSLLHSTLGRALLDHYRSLRDKPGFVVLLHNLIAELKAAGIGPARFAEVVAALGDLPRLQELARIYTEYQQQLEANAWADEEELGWLALRALRGMPQLATDWSLLVVDGFDNLTTVQLDLLRVAVCRAQETIITLTGAMDGLERVAVEAMALVQRRFLATRRALERTLELRAEPLPVMGQGETGSDYSARAGVLAHLERSLFVSRATSYVAQETADETCHESAGNAVTLVAASDRAGEVRAALRWLKMRLVRDGCPLKETALLARQIAPYRAFIEESAAEFGIPIRLLDGLPLATNPAVVALLDLLRLWLPLSNEDPQPSLPRRLVVEAWRSPYLDWTAALQACNSESAGLHRSSSSTTDTQFSYPAPADSLDALARWGQVVGGLTQWREAFTRRLGSTADARADSDDESPGLPSTDTVGAMQEPFERFVRRLQPPLAPQGVGDYVRWLEALIGPEIDEPLPEGEEDCSLRIVPCVRQGNKEETQRDLAALRALKDVLRGLVWAEEATGARTPASYASFCSQLRAAVEAALYYLPEDSDAEQLLVADVVQARGVSFRAVAVLGLAEGEFPVTLQEDPLLRDSDRQRMRTLELNLPPSTESAEAEYLYETITRARSQLLLTRPRLAENGAVWEPSPFWEEVSRLAGVEPRLLSSESRLLPAETASWPELLESLAACMPDSPWHIWVDRRDPVRYRAWQKAGLVFGERYARQPSGPHNGDLSEQAAELGVSYAAQHVWSASRLEGYRTCPQFFFVGAALGLQPLREPVEGLDASQLGTIYHLLFQGVYEACPEDARNDPQTLLAVLDQVGRQVLQDAPRREGFRETAWWSKTQEDILAVVRRSLQELSALGGSYTASEFERHFDATPVWESPDGQDCLSLRGIIDRVDRCSDGACRIIDYKTAGKSHFGMRALKEGRKLQLPLYALAVKQFLGAQVRDGFYWHVQQAEPSPLSLEAYGVEQSMEDALAFAREAVQGIRSGAFGPHPPAEGCPSYCPAAGFCWSFRPMYGG